MSASEIELTFIRCSSCKSLMPSTAVRCGMCGTVLQKSFSKEEVTQQYVMPPEKIEENKIVEKEPYIKREERGTDFRLQNRSSNSSNSSFDRESIREEKKSAVLSFAKEMRVINQNNPSRTNLEIDNIPSAEELRNNFLDQFDETEEGYDEESQLELEPKVEQNNRNYNEQESNQSIELRPLKKKKRKRKKKRVLPVDENTLSVNITEPLSEVVIENKQEIIEKNFKKEEKVYSTDSRPKLETGFRTEREVEDTGSEQSRQGNIMNNKLVGWFVSCGIEQTGKSFEIREGRKFIGRQQLRNFDLVIPDSAVSTPHCLLQVDDNGVNLQDLMSDQGTFIKKQGDRDFRKIESSMTLKHGDVLKLGSFELIVCLIPE